MPNATKTLSLMRTLTRADIRAMTPWDRRTFAAMCRHWADAAEKIEAEPVKPGVLSKLDEGDRSQ